MLGKIVLFVVLFVFTLGANAHIGKFTIQNMSSQQCMSAGTAAAISQLQHVTCATKTGPKDPMQLWRLVSGTGQNSDSYYILSEGSALCLQTSLNGEAKLAACAVNNHNQLFILMSVDQIAGGGQATKHIYRIMSVNNLQCLSLKTATGTDTAKGLVTQVCDNGASQTFMLNRMGASNHHTHKGSSSSSSSGDASSSSGNTSTSSGSTSSTSGGSSSWIPPAGGQKDQKVSGVYITWYGFDDNSCETEAQHTCDNIAFAKSDGFPTVHNTTMEDLGTYHNPITLAAAANDNGKGGPWPVGTLFYVPIVHKYFVMEDQCMECGQDYRKGKKHIDLYMGPNKVGGSNLIHCEEALTTTSSIIVNPSEGYPVETQKIYTPGNCTSKHNFPTNVIPTPPSSTSSSSGSASSSGTSSSGNSSSSSSSSSGNVGWVPPAIIPTQPGSIKRGPLIVDSLDGAVTQNEMDSFVGYISGVNPGASSDGNEWAQGHSGENLKALGLVYEITGRMPILDRMIFFCDKLLSQRNDLPGGGHHVLWTGRVDPAWPNMFTTNPIQTGGEQGDPVGHLGNCAKLILRTVEIRNMTVPIGDPYNYGVTYLDRAKKYVLEAERAVDEHILRSLLNMSNNNRMYFSSSSPYKTNQPVPWNQQMMFNYGFTNLAESHALLGDAPDKIKKYDAIVQASMDWFFSDGVTIYKDRAGNTAYDWAYAIPSKSGVSQLHSSP